tara:strand:+ start:25 stop:573 length:549 start_codon:yes stop_codon:yes gene_type:complete
VKTYQEYVITEIKSTVPRSEWSWVQLGVDGGEAIWHSDQGTIQLVIQKDERSVLIGEPIGRDSDEFYLYHVAFTRDGEWNQTNQGGAGKIFPWVVERVKEFLKIKPEIVRFTAKREETSRIRLYDSMVKSLLRKEPEYELIEIKKSAWGKGKPYYIVHETVTEGFMHDELVDALTDYNQTYA